MTTKTMPNFNVTKEETILIHKIAKRAMTDEIVKASTDLLSLSMDITATHNSIGYGFRT